MARKGFGLFGNLLKTGIKAVNTTYKAIDNAQRQAAKTMERERIRLEKEHQAAQKKAEKSKLKDRVRLDKEHHETQEKIETERMKSMGFVRVSVDYLNSFINGASIDEQKFLKLLREDQKYIWIEKEKLNAMREKLKKYQKDSNELSQTALLNNKGITFEKAGKIDAAIAVYEENIKLGWKANHSFDRLGVIYRNRRDFENEKRVLRRKYEIFKLDKDDLEKDLKRIDDKLNGVKSKYVLPKEPITIPAKKNDTLGFECDVIEKKLPEFDFYKNKPDDMSTNDYLWSHHNLVNDNEYKPILWNIQKKFKSMIEEAQAFEKDYDLASASAVYEKMINEQFDLYGNLRCGLLHIVIPGSDLELIQEQEINDYGEHLEVKNLRKRVRLILVSQRLMKDFEDACNEVIRRIDKKEIVNQKVYGQLLSTSPND